MILSVRCDKKSFKEVRFGPSFNIVLADKTSESTDKDSRNGLGKSSLIQIIHFCLGGDLSESLERLNDWTFTLDIIIKEKKYSISRNTNGQRKIIIEGDCSMWPLKPEIDKGIQYLATSDFTKVLGELMFGIGFKDEKEKYTPSFRSCISYFARQNGKLGGFLDPFSHYRHQREGDKQINSSFLLGLDWTYATKWQEIKDHKKILDQLKRASREGMLGEMIGSMGDLDARRVNLESRIGQIENELSNFRVHPQYRTLEERANQITTEIHSLSNDNISDRQLLKYYENSFEEEKEANIQQIKQVYEEVGIEMPKNVITRLEDILEFHKNIVINRKDFLNSEIDHINMAINKRDNEIKKISDERAELLGILKTHKALEEYNGLGQRHLAMVSELNDIERRIDNLKKFEQGRSALNVELELLQQKARISLGEREEVKNNAIKFFNLNSDALYKTPGLLKIDVSNVGYQFKVEINKEGSHGVQNMKIFCYDLMLSQLFSKKVYSPGFLIHDSIIFADVDERQVARALELAAKESKEKGFQYICTLNSDSIPNEYFTKNFNIKDFIRITFTDASDDGGLFGIKF